MASPSGTHEEIENVEEQPQQNEQLTQFSVEDTRATLQALSSTIHDVNSLPNGDSRDVALLTNPNVAQHWDTTVNRITHLLSSFLLNPSSPNQSTIASDKDEDTVRMRVSDAVDDSLERAHTALDSVQGLRDKPTKHNNDKASQPASKSKKSMPLIPGLNQRLPRDYKPQRKFPDYPIDNSASPFIPPYSKSRQHVPVDDDNESTGSESSSDTKKKRAKKTKQKVLHPYHKEIAESVRVNSALVYDEDSVQVFRGLQNAPLTFIDTVDELVKCANKLRNCTEIAVDLEAHQERSFQGFTCLMQISTRHEDFIIDTISLRGSIHATMAPIFTDSSIRKVMHGADNDVEWLERCFGIYVVNMFDTGQAARALYPLCSLSYLLTKYCDVKSPDKRKYQRADWRVRPLHPCMIEYARSDTHYLLYIADRLQGDLSKKEGKWKEVCEKSGGVCTRRWRKPKYRPYRAMSYATKYGLGFDVMQVCVLQALLKWRDDTARAEDESVAFVCSNRVLFEIVKTKEKGMKPKGFADALKDRTASFARKYKVEIAQIITQTRESGVDKKLETKIKRRLEKQVKRERANAKAKTAGPQPVDQVVESQSGTDSTTTITDDIADSKPSTSRAIPKQASKSRAAARTSLFVPKLKVRGKLASALIAEDSDSASEDAEMEGVVAKVLHEAKNA